jgi:c-di-GMP-binding flagellar brake protein YcgR
MRLFTKRKDDEEIGYAPFFAVNDPVRLEMRGRLFTSRVEDITSDGLWIATPLARGPGSRFNEGDTVKMVSSIRSGLQGFLVRIGEHQPGPPDMLFVLPVKALGKSQLRDFARVPDMLDIKFRVLEGNTIRGTKIALAKTRNISGGGLLVLVARDDRPFSGEEIEIDIAVATGEQVRCRGRVVRIDPIEGIHDSFEMAVRFTSIDEQDRKRLIQRVYSREAELRRVGLL